MSQHEVWIENGVVKMSEDNRGQCIQDFRSRNEINALINRLIQARDEAFPKLIITPIKWVLEQFPITLTSITDHSGTVHQVSALEYSTNGRFRIAHIPPKRDGTSSYAFFNLERMYITASHERVENWNLVSMSDKILNLKSIADLMNQENQPK